MRLNTRFKAVFSKEKITIYKINMAEDKEINRSLLYNTDYKHLPKILTGKNAHIKVTDIKQNQKGRCLDSMELTFQVYQAIFNRTEDELKTIKKSADKKKVERLNQSVQIDSLEIPWVKEQDVIMNVAHWLYQNKKISEKDAPISIPGVRVKYLLNTLPINANGRRMDKYHIISPGLYLNTSISSKDAIRYSQILMERYAKGTPFKIIGASLKGIRRLKS